MDRGSHHDVLKHQQGVELAIALTPAKWLPKDNVRMPNKNMATQPVFLKPDYF